MSSPGFPLEGPTAPTSPSSSVLQEISQAPKSESDPGDFDKADTLSERVGLHAEAGENYEDWDVIGEEEVSEEMEMSFAHEEFDNGSRDEASSLVSVSSHSSFSSEDEDDEDLERMIDLIERQINLGEPSFVGGDEVNVDDEGYGNSPHVVEYWSVGKRGNPKTLIKKYMSSMKS